MTTEFPANPYQAPASLSAEPATASDELNIATTGQRLANLLLDTFFYYVVCFIAGIILGLSIAFSGGDQSDLNRLFAGPGQYVFSFSMMILYYFIQEAMFSRTVGKLITGTKVVSEDGSPISTGQALGRTLCRLIPFEAFSFLGGNGRPVGWHDSIPKTRVIRVAPR